MTIYFNTVSHIQTSHITNASSIYLNHFIPNTECLPGGRMVIALIFRSMLGSNTGLGVTVRSGCETTIS